MKKSLIALAVAGLSFNAAAVNLSAANQAAIDASAQNYASEIIVSPTATLKAVSIEKAVAANDKVNATPAEIADGSAKPFFARIDVAGAKIAGVTLGQRIGGNTGWEVVNVQDNSIVVKTIVDRPLVSAVGGVPAHFAMPADLTFTADAVVADKAGATVKVRVFNDQNNAVSGQAGFDVVANAKSGKLFGFAQGFKVGITVPTNPAKIAVEKDALQFVSNSAYSESANLFNVDSTAAATAPATVLDITGSPISDSTLLGKWEVKGPFLVGSTVNGGAALTAETAAKAVTVTANKPVTYALPAKNNTPITEGVFTATYTPDATQANFYALTKQDFTFDLTKNGSSADQDLVFSADSSYKTFVRVSNLGGQAGKISFTVYGDDGSSATFPLSAVAGQETATLNAQASTSQIALKDLHAAAVAAGLAEKAGKLRIVASGDVSKLSLQTYVLSTDGTTFSRF
ncbi:hypothetical protein NUK42_07940 [Aeromonas veronii]|uniref:hypothetical protein n=1 Tax=Aeromonas veronii TaxID=654 RepID=UPI00214E728D|nr:hypothetical protein [Aeromonas veronii]MCR3958677.1 hypothetical protein [Aeromonas veronii]